MVDVGAATADDTGNVRLPLLLASTIGLTGRCWTLTERCCGCGDGDCVGSEKPINGNRASCLSLPLFQKGVLLTDSFNDLMAEWCTFPAPELSARSRPRNKSTMAHMTDPPKNPPRVSTSAIKVWMIHRKKGRMNRTTFQMN